MFYIVFEVKRIVHISGTRCLIEMVFGSKFLIGKQFIFKNQNWRHVTHSPWSYYNSGHGGALVFEVGYHPRNHSRNKGCFQDQAMYVRTSLRVQKCSKLEKRGCFLSCSQILERTWHKIFLKACQNAYLESIFMPGKYMLRACYEIPFTRMILK